MITAAARLELVICGNPTRVSVSPLHPIRKNVQLKQIFRSLKGPVAFIISLALSNGALHVHDSLDKSTDIFIVNISHEKTKISNEYNLLSSVACVPIARCRLFHCAIDLHCWPKTVKNRTMKLLSPLN